MGKIVASFDSYYSLEEYEARQAIAQFRKAPGVKAVKVFRAVDSRPAYSIEIEGDDGELAEVLKRIDVAMGPYKSYLSNYSARVFKELTI